MTTFLWGKDSFDSGFRKPIDRIVGFGGSNSPYILYRDKDKTIYTELFEGLRFVGWKIESLTSKEYFIRRLKGK